MLMKDTAMTVVNAVGLVLQLCYVFMYYLYATNKVLTIFVIFHNLNNYNVCYHLQGPYLKQVVIVFSVILSTMFYVAVEPIEDKAEFRLGLLCCATTLIFCSAPLATLVCMKFFFSLTFLMGIFFSRVMS